MDAVHGMSLMMRTVEGAIASVRMLPTGVHVSAVIALVTGLILWLYGGRVLKPAHAFIGLSLGALGGALTFPSLAPDHVIGIPSPYVGMAIGAVLGLALATALFRFAMSIAGAATFACVGALGVALYLSFSGPIIPPDPAAQSSLKDAEPSALRQNLDESWKALKDTGHKVLTSDDIPKDKQVKESAVAAATKTREFVDQMTEDGKSLWNRLPNSSRLMLLAGAGCGALLGFVLGAFAPKKTSGITTALLGAGVWLTATAWIVRASDVSTFRLSERVDELGPVSWAVIWGVTALIGLMVQMRRGKKEEVKKPKVEATQA